MARKNILEHRPSPPPFSFFGISCHGIDYQLAFHLNRKLEMELGKMDDFREHSLYFYRDLNGFNQYYLLGNRTENTVLIPEFRQMDYFFLVEGPYKKLQRDHLVTAIRSVPLVLIASEIRPDAIKDHDLLLHDLEMHFSGLLKP